MRAFVVGTGRCGTTTFSEACMHATNYTVGHETATGRIADWGYPENHIEVSAPLVVAIPILRRRYPAARWVHLIRADKRTCAQSLRAMSLGRTVRAFAWVFFQSHNPNLTVASEAMYDCLNGMCDLMLPEERFTLTLEHAKEQWLACWQFMRCEGDYHASLQEWDVRYNRRDC